MSTSAQLYQSLGGTPPLLKCVWKEGDSATPDEEDGSDCDDDEEGRGSGQEKRAKVVVRSEDPSSEGQSKTTESAAPVAVEETPDTISDMLLFLETHYRGKLMNMLLTDVKRIVAELKHEDELLAAKRAQEERLRRAKATRVRQEYPTQLGGGGYMDANRKSVVAARAKIMEAENSSRRLIARMYVLIGNFADNSGGYLNFTFSHQVVPEARPSRVHNSAKLP